MPNKNILNVVDFGLFHTHNIRGVKNYFRWLKSMPFGHYAAVIVNRPPPPTHTHTNVHVGHKSKILHAYSCVFPETYVSGVSGY